MSYRKVPIVSGEYYHIYNRGNSKQLIFLDDQDRKRFIELLYISNSKEKVSFRNDVTRGHVDVWGIKKGENIISIGAWVLMPNHFHLYVTSPTLEVGKSNKEERESDVSFFMRKLAISYVKYFNKKYERTGGLFEGNFKSTHISKEIQAKYLFSYIHLNPIKMIDSKWKENGIKNKEATLKFLEQYKWGSYLDYFGMKRKENLILDRENFPNYFLNISDFNKEILSWIKIE